MRKFEIITNYKDKEVVLPTRSTKFSAGYDLSAAADVVLRAGSITKIVTGLKVYMEENEYLQLSLRSGFAIKNCLIMPNAPGVIDFDYADNPDNEGHIMVAVYNPGEDYFVTKGDRVAQGIFQQYSAVSNEAVIVGNRQGGIGSTGK